MKKQKMILALILSLLLIVLTACGGSTSSKSNDEEEVITLKLATYVAPTSPIYKYLTEPWMKKVTELTDGKVQFDFYPGEQLGKAHDLLQLTRDKVADISVFPANYFADNMALTNALTGLPNLSETAYQGTMAYNDLLAENKELLEKDYLKNGIRPLMGHVSPTYEIWSTKKEVRTPKDLKGMKIRTTGGLANSLYEYMEAIPVTVSHTETYEALEKGIIEAANYSSVAVDASGTGDLLKYATMIHIGSAIHTVAINEQVWKSLPKDVQDAMIQAGEELTESSGKQYDEDTSAFNEEFVKNGGSILELSESDEKEWKKTSEAFTDKWLKENETDDLPYSDVLNEYKEKLKGYK